MHNPTRDWMGAEPLTSMTMNGARISGGLNYPSFMNLNDQFGTGIDLHHGHTRHERTLAESAESCRSNHPIGELRHEALTHTFLPRNYSEEQEVCRMAIKEALSISDRHWR